MSGVQELVAGAGAVLFDVGETLLWVDEQAVAGALELSPARVREGLAGMRAQVDRWAEAGVGGEPPDPAGLLLQVLELPAGDWAELGARLRRLDAEDGLWCVVAPDAAETLDALAASGRRVAAVSNSDGSAAHKLERAGLLSRLEFVLDSRLEGVAKPDPDLFLRAARRLGMSPGDCLYVGDVYSLDVLAARAAGLQAVLFDRLGVSTRPCVTVTRLGELSQGLS